MENRVNSESPSSTSRSLVSPKKLLASTSFEEGSSLVLDDLTTDTVQLEGNTSSSLEEGFDEPLPGLKYQSRSPYRLSVKLRHLFKMFKWSLLIINGLLVCFLIAGVFIYFTELHDSRQIKWMSVDEETFCHDRSGMRTDVELKTGPRYAWVISMLIFALLLVIPCVGLLGAIWEHLCMLILYGVIYFVNAIVVLIFNPIWFLIPAYISVASLGLAFLIRKRRGLFSTKLPDKLYYS